MAASGDAHVDNTDIGLSLLVLQVFQCLLIEGENVGPDARRNAESFVITDAQFDSFLERHKRVKQLVPESNTAMRDSYLILDEYVCCIDS